MKPKIALAQLTVLTACFAPSVSGQAVLDAIDEKLTLQTEDGFFRTDLSGLIDLEEYYIDQHPPGLIVTSQDHFFNPRLSLFLDTQIGKHFYSLVQVRADRGFDPGVAPDGEIRFDEYLLRYTPFDDARLNVQAGKFATVFGNWVQRHDSWSNPLINAPLAYERMLPVTDVAATGSPAAFLARRDKPDSVPAWLPIIWGPSYATGASLFGSLDKFDYAFEFKNTALSSRPAAWDPFEVNWANPTYTGRVGVRPDAAWNVGASVSHGGYALPDFGPGFKNFAQTTIGSDVSFSWRHWQFWAEAMASRFEIPTVGDADTLAYYLEAKYKFSSSVFGALRWNQQFFDDIPNGAGGMTPWDRDAWRTDAALGWRFTRHLQTKLQYSYSHQKGPLQQGEQMVAVQLTVKF